MHNRVNIEIFGSEYPITTPEDPAYVEKLGEEIDDAVRTLMTESGTASLPEALVLLTLNYLDLYKKSEKNADNLREQLTDYLDEASQARMELAEARAEIERLGRD